MKIVSGIFRIFLYFIRIFARGKIYFISKKVLGPAEPQPGHSPARASPSFSHTRSPRRRLGSQARTPVPAPPRPSHRPPGFISRRPASLSSSSAAAALATGAAPRRQATAACCRHRHRRRRAAIGQRRKGAFWS